MTVVFTPNGNGGSPITSYSVSCVSTNGGVAGTRTGTASPIKVINLSGSKSYRCRVRATNAVGTGPYSAYGATQWPCRPPAVPAAPTVDGFDPLGGAMSVAFASNGNGGSPITSYSVQCLSTNGGVAGDQELGTG